MEDKISEIQKKLCLKIKFERIKRNMTQDRLGQLSGISQSSIWAIEAGRSVPSTITLAKIANAFGITISELTDISKVEL